MTPPLTTFRFEVVLDLEQPTVGLPSPLCEAAFAECDGLEMTMQTKTIEVGGLNDRQVHLIGPVQYGELVLKRGMTDRFHLWDWFARGTRPGSVLKAHGEVTIWASDGTPAAQFTLIGCLPKRLRAPGLNAKDGLVAIEEMTISYEQLVLGAPGSSAGISAGVSAGVSAGASAGISAGASLGASVSFSAGASASVGVGFG